MRYCKGKSTLMIYDRYLELQSKWNKAFWERGYYVETIGNINYEVVQKYIKEWSFYCKCGKKISVFKYEHNSQTISTYYSQD